MRAGLRSRLVGGLGVITVLLAALSTGPTAAAAEPKGSLTGVISGNSAHGWDNVAVVSAIKVGATAPTLSSYGTPIDALTICPEV